MRSWGGQDLPLVREGEKMVKEGTSNSIQSASGRDLGPGSRVGH